jgi:hypothetical protein
MSADPKIHHFHMGDPESDHDHNYLNQQSQTNVGGLILSEIIPADVYVALSSLGGLLWHAIFAAFHGASWVPELASPPPRNTPSFSFFKAEK